MKQREYVKKAHQHEATKRKTHDDVRIIVYRGMLIAMQLFIDRKTTLCHYKSLESRRYLRCS